MTREEMSEAITNGKFIQIKFIEVFDSKEIPFAMSHIRIYKEEDIDRKLEYLKDKHEVTYKAYEDISYD